MARVSFGRWVALLALLSAFTGSIAQGNTSSIQYMYSYNPTRMTYLDAAQFCANATVGGRLAGISTDPNAKAFIYAMCQDPKAKCWVQDNRSPDDGFCTFTADGGISVNQADCGLPFFFICARPVWPSPPPSPPRPPPPAPPSPPAFTTGRTISLNGTFFTIISNGLSYPDALAACQSLNGDLAPWSNATARSAINELCSSSANTDPNGRCWVGPTVDRTYRPGDVNCTFVRSGFIQLTNCSTAYNFVCRRAFLPSPPPPPPSPPAPPPSPPVITSLTSNGFDYQFFTSPSDYPGAMSSCAMFGGELAPWNDTDSQRAIITFCASASNPDPNGWCWVGSTETNVYSPDDLFCNGARRTGATFRLDCTTQRSYICRKPIGTPPLPASPPPESTGSLTLNGFSYSLVTDVAAYPSALAACQNQGGEIAPWLDASSRTAINTLCSTERCWVGPTRDGTYQPGDVNCTFVQQLLVSYTACAAQLSYVCRQPVGTLPPSPPPSPPSPPAMRPPPSPPSPSTPGVLEVFGFQYTLVTSPDAYEDANNTCVSEGGVMAPWFDSNSRTAIRTLCSSSANTDPSGRCWVGPTVDRTYQPGDVNCTSLRNGFVSLLTCSTPLNFVCRKPVSSPPPASPPSPPSAMFTPPSPPLTQLKYEFVTGSRTYQAAQDFCIQTYPNGGQLVGLDDGPAASAIFNVLCSGLRCWLPSDNADSNTCSFTQDGGSTIATSPCSNLSFFICGHY